MARASPRSRPTAACAGEILALRITGTNGRRLLGQRQLSQPSRMTEKRGWLGRLAAGLKRTSSRLSEGIAGIFVKRRLDKATLAELEDLLISADLGPATAAKLVEELGRDRLDKEIGEQEIREILAGSIAKLLEPVAKPLIPDPAHKPFVVLVVGVNGSGKTTTIGKLAQFHREAGRRVVLAAGDTFRAAAIEQLKIWGERTGATVIAGEQGADPAGLAYDALVQARAEGADLLLVDTAGRLHNKANLMAELAKVIRVLRRSSTRRRPMNVCWSSTPPWARTPISRSRPSAIWCR